jgi:UDP-glucose 4-epimerase
MLYGVKIVALRYFSVYGPHEEYKKQYANLITQFLWAIEKGEPIVIFGDGKQTRDFTYVTDIVEANMKAAAHAENIGFGAYNVGTGKNYTINEMVSMLEKAAGKKTEVKHVENKIKNYVHETLADVRKAEKELNFKAKTSLEEGIRLLIREYSSRK